MLQRFGQLVTVVLVSSAVIPFCANAQRAAGAPMSVAVAPHVMAAPVAAAPVMHASAAHFSAGALAPAHLGPSAIAHPTVPHHPVPVKPVSPHPTARNYPAPSQPGHTNMPFPNNGFNDGFNDGNFPVPGLGFDYAHFAAVHPGAFHHHFHGGGIVPFIGGGLYVPFEYYSEPYSTPEQPAEPKAEPEQEQAAPQQDYSTSPAYAPPRERSNAPLATSPEYIFVRRDGSVFFAVAYSSSNGSLQYITRDGLRRVIPITTLDLDATSQFNEQRGLSFRSPA